MVDRRRGTIVIADADQHGREQASEVLRRSGYETVTVDTGVAALDAVRAGDVALVLLEVALPEISGYEVLRIVRDNDPHIAVIFLSGSRTDPLHRVAGLLLGADDFITKPFNSDELVARVERFVTRYRAAPREPAREQPHQRASDGDLTLREREVLTLLGSGYRQRDIAAQLVISQKTVGKHIQNLLAKFGVHSRAELIARAYQVGYLVALAGTETM